VAVESEKDRVQFEIKCFMSLELIFNFKSPPRAKLLIAIFARRY
jgi:hypothetical protein